MVRHPNQGNPPLAVASYFATSHNIPSISSFLQSFCRALCIKRSLPKLLMCDGSTALMNAIVLSMFFRRKHSKTIYIVVGWLLQGSTPHRFVNFLFFISAHITSWKTRRNLWKKSENVFLSFWNVNMHGSMQLKASCFTFVTVFWQFFLSVVMLLKRTNAPYSHDRCLTVMTQLLSVRSASQP